MTNYRYLGYGVTDSNGVAHLDHDANGDPLTHSYTGVGAGEVDVLASLDNPVSSGSIVSETYEVLDCVFYEDGTTGTPNTYWSADTGLNVTPSSNGILLENTTSSGKVYAINLPDVETSSIFDFNLPLVVEFDVISTTGIRFFINSSTGGTNLDKNFTSSITGNNKVKFIIRNNSYDLIIDNGTPTTTNCNLVNPIGIRFVVVANCNFQFKNFKIYPI